MASLVDALTIAFDLYAAGRYGEAVELCRRILDVAPDQAAAAQVAGAALAALGRPVDSGAAFRRLLILRPADAAGWCNLANLQTGGDGAAALAGYGRALTIARDLVEAWANRAGLLTQRGRRGDGARAARTALALDPAHAGALVNLADAMIGQNREQAAVWGARAARRSPWLGTAWLTWGAALAAGERLAEGLAAVRRARIVEPQLARAAETEGLICARLGDFAAADAALTVAAALGGGASLPRTRVMASLAMGRPLAALPDIDIALAAAPDDAGMHWNRAVALLQAGRWAAGWREFEWRRHDAGARPPWRNLGVPMWDGAPFCGRRLLLYAEQGLGDALQMLRFVPVVAALGGEVILEVQAPLVGLARRVAGAGRVLARGDALPDFDLECPLMSLPGVLGATPDAIPGATPFLTAEPARVESWRKRLDAAGPGRRIGLVWAGNPQFPDDRQRSPRLAPLLPLLADFPAAHFFALQMGDGRRDLDGARLPDNFTDLGGEIRDLDDTAALMAGMDLIISPCTLPAHLAIALGRPLWLMLCLASDWRWLLEREDTPWSPTTRLFRQTAPGDWAGVVNRMRAASRAVSPATAAAGLP